MRRLLAVAVTLVAVFGLVLPAMAQAPAAPAPKVTITGTIDQIGTWTKNMSVYDLNYGRARDDQMYGRTRGRFDVVGEIGAAKAVLGIEIDAYYGQTSNTDRNVTQGTTAASNQGASANGAFDLNTDVAGIIEIKWLYTEFPMFLIPNTVVRLGAQPFGAAATYKLAAYANGDFAGVNWVTTFGPAAALNLTYVQIEEELTGLDFYTTSANAFRGEDWAVIASFDFSPFKGLDIKPMYSYAHIAGITSGSTRQGRGGIPNAATAFRPTDVEARHTIGVDARWTAGPITIAPTVLYQFGNRDTTIGAAERQADLSAWFADIRAGFQVGPLTISAMGMYTTGNKAGDNLTSKIRYYQPLNTDTSYAADWGTQIYSLGIDYFNILQFGGTNPGVAIGYDRYGRIQVGAKVAYAVTPALTIGAAVTPNWTAQKVDTSSTLSAAGLTPGDGSGDERYLGTELNLSATYRFAPGVTFDLAGGYLFAGDALKFVSTHGSANVPFGGTSSSDPDDVKIVTARVRFAF
jgi:hypothetical protein